MTFSTLSNAIIYPADVFRFYKKALPYLEDYVIGSMAKVVMVLRLFYFLLQIFEIVLLKTKLGIIRLHGMI